LIDDLDRSLEVLLRQALPATLVEQVNISFATPDDQFPPQSVTPPAIDLFLYDVRENRELRSNDYLVSRDGNGRVTKERAPVRVDCSYLITAWPSASSNTPALEEHRILGEVMRVLVRFPTLPPGVLSGSLAGQVPPLPACTLHPGRLQSLAEFWQALGGKPKAAINFTVTIGVEAEEPAEAGPAVTEVHFRFHQGPRGE